MKIDQIAKKPELIKLTTDSEIIRENYGEDLEFYMYDIQPMGVLVKLTSLTEKDLDKFMDVLEEVVLNEEGNKVCADGKSLPLDVMTAVVQKVGEYMGKHKVS